MFKIGDFSRLTQVTVKALRHYDSLGLLIPDHIDPESGYRYYTSAQLPRLNRILALKEMGFSLEQVGQLLDADLSSDQVRAMLLQKQTDVQDQIETEQRRLLRIETRLRQLQDGVLASKYDVVLKSVDAMRVASLRGMLPSRSAIGRLFRELHRNLRTYEISGSTHMTIWHDADYHDREVDAEAAIMTDAPIPDGGRLVARVLPAVGSMACVIHQGPSETIGDGCQALLRWIEGNGYELDGPERVVMLQRGADWSDVVVEMQYPVRQSTDG